MLARACVRVGVALVAVALACSSEAPREGAAGGPFRVALLTPGSIRDGGWNQGAYEGLKTIEQELGCEVAHQETRTPQEFEAGFRDFAARGFRLVFGHGFEFQDAAAKVGAEYPQTIFITTSGSTVRENVAPMVFELEEATYVLGWVGAKYSRNGKLGAVGGVEIPSVASTFKAFEAGAKAARSDAEFTASYLGNWEDIPAAREAALALISTGVDVLIQNADAAGRGVFQAAQRRNPTIVFGTNRNQNSLALNVVLASATIDLPRALLAVAREVQEGHFKARPIHFHMADGVIGIAWNEGMLSQRPGWIRTEADAVAGRILAGEIQVPRLTESSS